MTRKKSLKNSSDSSTLYFNNYLCILLFAQVYKIFILHEKYKGLKV